MTLRVGVIGCGSIARRSHLPAFKSTPDVEIVAFASRTRGSADAAAAEHGTGEAVDGLEALLSRVDAVDICSPNAEHVLQAVDAATAGKHVLVEKPVACTVSEADAMIEAADRAGVVLHVAHNLRYIAPVLAARDVIASGRVGMIVGLRAAFGHAGPRGWAPDSTWFYDRSASGGGALIDLGIHIIDLVRFVTGLEATEVSAMTTSPATSRAVEDSAQVLVRYEGGAAGSIHASWVARPAPDMMLTVFGTEGTLHFDARTPLTLRHATAEKEQVEMPDANETPYADFVRAARGEQPEGPAATGRDGRAALAIVEAAYASATSGKIEAVAR